ncbi:MAG: very short patch repair endonuclease [Candidatus Binataceae bacterium]
MDILTRSERSEVMSRVRGKDTRPEMLVRRLIHAMGYRYRLHRRDLPGVPDLVFVGRRKIIFIHGCFWHRHPDCPNNRMPKSNVTFWRKKLSANRRRDRANLKRLLALDWKALVLWECQLRDVSAVRRKVRGFLEE